MRTRRYPSLTLAGLLCACGGEAPAPLESSEVAEELTGVDPAVDGADYACHVVLRSIGRRTDADGEPVRSSGRFVFDGELHVSEAALAEGAKVRVLYQRAGDATWRSVAGRRKGDDGNGRAFYSFALTRSTPGDGATLRVIPYLLLAEGGRLFDHNRLEDPFATYELSPANGYALADEARVCPVTHAGEEPAAVLPEVVFGLDGETQTGPLMAGREAQIRYDLDRLTTCRGTHNGYGAWDVIAHVRFQPSGRIVSGSVRSFLTNHGAPTPNATAVPLGFRLPDDAVRIEVWFENTGIGCTAWDSNHGRDFVFPVLSAPGWIGSPRVKITRAGGHPCADGTPAEGGFSYSTWARSRAVFGNFCFEVWKAGVTDFDNPDLWRLLDARAYYRFDPGQPFQSQPVELVERAGNNALYRLDVAALDPFRPMTCPTVPTTFDPNGGGYVRAQLELYFEVNGARLSAPGGAPFVAVYEDYASNPYRDSACR